MPVMVGMSLAEMQELAAIAAAAEQETYTVIVAAARHSSGTATAAVVAASVVAVVVPAAHSAPAKLVERPTVAPAETVVAAVPATLEPAVRRTS